VVSSLQLFTVASLLERVQNATAQSVLGLLLPKHVSPALVELHCLPVLYHIQFYLVCLLHMAHWFVSLITHQWCCDPVSRDLSHHWLYSADSANMLYKWGPSLGKSVYITGLDTLELTLPSSQDQLTVPQLLHAVLNCTCYTYSLVCLDCWHVFWCSYISSWQCCGNYWDNSI